MGGCAVDRLAARSTSHAHMSFLPPQMGEESMVLAETGVIEAKGNAETVGNVSPTLPWAARMHVLLAALLAVQVGLCCWLSSRSGVVLGCFCRWVVCSARIDAGRAEAQSARARGNPRRPHFDGVPLREADRLPTPAGCR